MATTRQKRVAKALIENVKLKKPLTRKEILVNSGYSASIASQNPAVIVESEGVLAELSALGFHEDGAKAVVQSILYDKRVAPADRLKASDQVFKVQGTYAPEKQAIVHAFVLPDEEKSRIDNILNDND
jgi:Holliday junction resolvasome RuvABC DNA-binding subunit